MNIEIFIPGLPGTAGSKKAFAIKKGGHYTGRTIVTDSAGERGKRWMQTVKQFVAEIYQGPPLRDTPMVFGVRFYLPRPKGHYGAGKKSQELKASSPVEHLQKPDALKMARAVEDALTNILWYDDCQVVDYSALSKHWADESPTGGPGCLLTVRVKS
jgi:Holliday junction resolvase RusA-like endonuclease